MATAPDESVDRLPVAYRRLTLRIVAGISYVGVAVLRVADQEATSGSRWATLAVAAVVGFWYLWASSDLRLDAREVRIRNPLRQVRIPLRDVEQVVTGTNLRVVAQGRTFTAWGVESSNLSLATGIATRQEKFARAVESARESAAEPPERIPVRYRPRLPDILWWACTAAIVAALFVAPS